MSPRPAARPLIAVVEDDPAVRNSLEFALGTHGFEVCAFERAADALDSPRVAAADCLVIDYALPDVHGVELLCRLRRRGVVCPAIIIASNPGQRCRREAEQAGAPIVEKPLMGGVLSEQIRSML
jgi:FixJ family two-component response regulator